MSKLETSFINDGSFKVKISKGEDKSVLFYSENVELVFNPVKTIHQLLRIDYNHVLI